MKFFRNTRVAIVGLLAVPCLEAPCLANDTPVVVERQKLLASDASAWHGMGWATRIDGNRLVVGTEGAEAAYAFVRGPGGWSEQEILSASDGFAGQRFSWSVDVSGDTIIVGAARDGDSGADSGAAYVYEWSGTSWTEQEKLAPPALVAGDFFGGGVAISGDTLVVGATGDGPGSAHVFVRSGMSWTHQAELVQDTPGSPFDAFGGRLAIDGDTIVVGVPNENTFVTGGGAIYVFVRSGASWSQQAHFAPGDVAFGDGFGGAVSVDGDTLLAGAHDDDSAGNERGAAYVFVRSGTSWTQEAELFASDGANHDAFGFSVAVQGDVAYVGAVVSEASTGSCYRFARTGTVWTETNKVLPGDATFPSFFSASIDFDGGWLAVGAYMNNEAAERAGACYMFEEMTGTPGVALCFGDGSGVACPCGNDSTDLGTGCVHSGGVGMRIIGAGSTSISADDLSLAACDCPVNNTGIFVVGQTSAMPVTSLYDGLFCIGGESRRFQGLFQHTGTASDSAFVAQDPSGIYFQPGLDYYFQYWSRDVAAGVSPCGLMANLSPAYQVVMTP